MKKPWLTFAGLCAVVLAIVMICVIFGSYTSMLRSKNRVNTARTMLATDCMAELDLVPVLLSRTQDNLDPGMISRITANAEQAKKTVSWFQSPDSPPDEGQFLEFEAVQTRLAADIQAMVQALDQDSLAKTAADLRQKTIYSAKRYNREVQYFTTRKSIFPGFLTARWFNLDKVSFPEIDINCFLPGD